MKSLRFSFPKKRTWLDNLYPIQNDQIWESLIDQAIQYLPEYSAG